MKNNIKVKVVPMTTNRGGAAANQFIIRVGDIEYFQSYSSIIAKVQDNIIELDKTYWDYSITTSKYRYSFLGIGKKEIEAKIASGEIKLVDLN